MNVVFGRRISIRPAASRLQSFERQERLVNFGQKVLCGSIKGCSSKSSMMDSIVTIVGS